MTLREEHVEQGVEIYEQRRLNRAFTHTARRAKYLVFQLVQIAEDDKKQRLATSTA